MTDIPRFPGAKVASWLGAAGLLVTLLVAGACGKKSAPAPAPRPQFEGTSAHPDHALVPQSRQCAVCHEDIFQTWSGSHHAWANRTLKPHLDSAPFLVGKVEQGEDTEWEFKGGGKPEIVWKDGDQEIRGHPPLLIGYTPLIQYLVSIGNGRLQAPDMAWDVNKKEWFSIYGGENRRPEEWGHWTQRGMNWNSQCAWCHMTDFHKNYDIATDSYKSSWVEQGVGCAQCHGPVKEGSSSPDCMIETARVLTPRQHMDNCATCHARREEFDENFKPGADFHNHYRLALPDQPGLYWPDGRQRDEVYNFTSLLLSKMGHAGVTCMDCHEPHQAKPKLPVNDNSICMQCHATGTERGGKKAQIINPMEHMFHDPGTPGGRCVDCHMPPSPYMARDPRHDHSFAIPDPLITKELGQPNACNECHGDKDTDWAIEWTNKWYGEKMNRPERDRSRAIHLAHNGRDEAREALLKSYDREIVGAWKATLLRLLSPWAGEDDINTRAVAATKDADPLVRAAAAYVLGPQRAFADTVAPLLNDPIRAVRFEAVWAMLDHLEGQPTALAEAEAIARHQADQPGGAARMARLAIHRGEPAAAEPWFRRVLAWDQTAAAPKRDFAVYLAGQGRVAESRKLLVEADKLEPSNPEYPYLLALADAEEGKTADAEKNLREAIRREPRFARAHYNLGLLLSARGEDAGAIAALREAEKQDRAGADAPYARATIHARLGQNAEAVAAAREALARRPDYQPAIGLLRALGVP